MSNRKTTFLELFQAHNQTGEAEKSKTETPKKERKDHRHHALDSIVVALTSPRRLQKISILSSKNQKNKLTLKENEKIIPPLQKF